MFPLPPEIQKKLNKAEKDMERVLNKLDSMEKQLTNIEKIIRRLQK